MGATLLIYRESIYMKAFVSSALGVVLVAGAIFVMVLAVVGSLGALSGH